MARRRRRGRRPRRRRRLEQDRAAAPAPGRRTASADGGADAAVVAGACPRPARSQRHQPGLAERRLDRRRRGLAEAADRRVAHRLPDLARAARSSSSREPSGCDPAPAAPAAPPGGRVPTRHGTHCPHDSSRKNGAIRRSVSTRSALLVEDQHHARAERRAGGARRLERERQVERRRPDEDARRAAEQDRLDVAPAWHAAGELEQVAQRRAERHLVQRPAARRGPTGRTAAGRSTASVPIRAIGRAALAQDERDVDERLDVVDDGRLAEQPDLDRERRLVARLAALALDRFEERGLLAADVRAGAAPDLDVEAAARAQDVVAEQAGGPRRADRVRASGPAPRGTRRGCRDSRASRRSRRRRSSSPRRSRTGRPRAGRGP